MTDREAIEAAYANLDLLADAKQPVDRTVAALDAGDQRLTFRQPQFSQTWYSCSWRGFAASKE